MKRTQQVEMFTRVVILWHGHHKISEKGDRQLVREYDGVSHKIKPVQTIERSFHRSTCSHEDLSKLKNGRKNPLKIPVHFIKHLDIPLN